MFQYLIILHQLCGKFHRNRLLELYTLPLQVRVRKKGTGQFLPACVRAIWNDTSWLWWLASEIVAGFSVGLWTEIRANAIRRKKRFPMLVEEKSKERRRASHGENMAWKALHVVNLNYPPFDSLAGLLNARERDSQLKSLAPALRDDDLNFITRDRSARSLLAISCRIVFRYVCGKLERA